MSSPLLRQFVAPALAAMLLAGPAGQVLAATYTFTGVTDSGSLVSTAFSGSFGFDDPLAGFDGSVALNSFTLHFAGQTYTLADADAGLTPSASFAAGSFVGVEYRDADAADAALRPFVAFTPGFSQFDEAYLMYDATGSGFEGFGSYQVTAVPEPGTVPLVLAGLGLLGAGQRRRAR